MSATVGSSDVAAILGLSPWASPWDAWGRLTGLVPRYTDSDDGAQARGRMLEPAILARYAVETGAAVWPGPPIGSDPVIGPEPWMHARPDGWAAPTLHRNDRGETYGCAEWLVEAKSTRTLGASEWGPPGTDEVPPWYAVQVVWLLAVTRLDRCDLAAYSALDDDWRVYQLRRDVGLEQRVVDRVRRWVDRHVVAGELPEADASEGCRRMLARRWRASEGTELQATPEEAELVHRALRLRATVADLQAELDTAVAQLQGRMGPADTLRVDGERVATWRERAGSRRVDLERLRRERPDVARQYTVAGEPGRTWRWT